MKEYIVTEHPDFPYEEPKPQELIRCRECKFSKAYYHGLESNLGMFTYLCTQGLYGMNADDYCSRAERKDNGADKRRR